MVAAIVFGQAAALQRTDSRLQLTCFLRGAALLFAMFDNAHTRLQIRRRGAAAARLRKVQTCVGAQFALVRAMIENEVASED